MSEKKEHSKAVIALVDAGQNFEIIIMQWRANDENFCIIYVKKSEVLAHILAAESEWTIEELENIPVIRAQGWTMRDVIARLKQIYPYLIRKKLDLKETSKQP